MDYKETLNLPKTQFPMRANLPQNEPKQVEKWERELAGGAVDFEECREHGPFLQGVLK